MSKEHRYYQERRNTLALAVGLAFLDSLDRTYKKPDLSNHYSMVANAIVRGKLKDYQKLNIKSGVWLPSTDMFPKKEGVK